MLYLRPKLKLYNVFPILLISFTEKSAKSFIAKITDEHNHCQKLTGVYPTKSNCFNYTIKQCFGACIEDETPTDYNKRATKIIDKHSFDIQNMVIVDRGRAVDERSAILVENGVFKGIGFYNLNYQINNIEVLQTIITPMQNNRDTQHIIQSYLRRKKGQKKNKWIL